MGAGEGGGVLLVARRIADNSRKVKTPFYHGEALFSFGWGWRRVTEKFLRVWTS